METRLVDDLSPRSGRHHIKQSIRQIGSRKALPTDSVLVDQIDSMRRESAKLRSEYERKHEQIRTERDQLETQRVLAYDMVKQLRAGLQSAMEQNPDQDLLRQMVTTTVNLQATLAPNNNIAVSADE
jgi:hypothetical protein